MSNLLWLPELHMFPSLSLSLSLSSSSSSLHFLEAWVQQSSCKFGHSRDNSLSCTLSTSHVDPSPTFCSSSPKMPEHSTLISRTTLNEASPSIRIDATPPTPLQTQEAMFFISEGKLCKSFSQLDSKDYHNLPESSTKSLGKNPCQYIALHVYMKSVYSTAYIHEVGI